LVKFCHPDNFYANPCGSGCGSTHTCSDEPDRVVSLDLVVVPGLEENTEGGGCGVGGVGVGVGGVGVSGLQPLGEDAVGQLRHVLIVGLPNTKPIQDQDPQLHMLSLVTSVSDPERFEIQDILFKMLHKQKPTGQVVGTVRQNFKLFALNSIYQHVDPSRTRIH